MNRAMRDAARWDAVELDLVRMLTAALGVAVPFGWGLLSHHVEQGAVATIGALLVSSSGHAGSVLERVADLAIGTCAGASSLCVGVLLTHHEGATAVGMPLIAGFLALIGPPRPVWVKASVLATVALVLSPGLAGPGSPVTPLVGWFVVGSSYAGGLTLIGHWLAGRITHGREIGTRAPRPAHMKLRERVATLAAWDYPLSLTLSLGIAELAAHLENKPHSTWIALTVVLVMQRDRATSINRTIQRALGTVLGVLIGGVVLFGFPDVLLIVFVATIGAIRGHLRLANYTSYALVMTPLVMIFLGAGHPVAGSLLAERAADTAIGCLIALVVGQVIWPTISRARRASVRP